MTRHLPRAPYAALLLALAAGGCKDFLTAKNISTVDAGDIDPVRDAATLSNSALQDFATAYSNAVLYQSWWTNETVPTETFQGPNDFARRDVSNSLGDVNDPNFAGLSRAIVSSGRVQDVLRGTPGEATNVDLARAELTGGYAFEFMAEEFCAGTVRAGPQLDTRTLLDSAQAHFTRAITIGRAANTAAATTIANAALVGRARSELQAGNKTAAATDAAAVPAGFTYNVNYFDDPANRDRLGNQLWQRTFARGSVSVSAAFRAFADPRVAVLPPGTPGFTPQDGVTPFFAQTKYTGYASPIRLASKLEADYILAEATGPSAELPLINARRAAAGKPAYAGATDAASLLTELMTQKSLDFFLEGKRLGDIRRNPANVLNVPASGTPYAIKPALGSYGTQTCYPIPLVETSNNPNFSKP